jgi:hypothetical protein
MPRQPCGCLTARGVPIANDRISDQDFCSDVKCARHRQCTEQMQLAFPLRHSEFEAECRNRAVGQSFWRLQHPPAL